MGDLDRLGRSDRPDRHARHDLVRRDPRGGRDSARRLCRDLVRPGGLIGSVTAQAAAATGLLPGTPVIAGGGDGQCAGTGAGVLTPGRAYVNLGTAMVSGHLWPALRCTTVLVPHRNGDCRGGLYLRDLLALGHLPGRLADARAARRSRSGRRRFPRARGRGRDEPGRRRRSGLPALLAGLHDPHWDNAARGVHGRPVGLLAPRRHLPGCCWKA